MSDLHPYDYHPERAGWQMMWLGVFTAAIVILGGLVYIGAQRANVASNTGTIEAPGATSAPTPGS